MPVEYLTDYAAARSEFCALADQRGAVRHEYPIAGCEGAIDVAILGTADAPGAVVASCGAHGVEGPVGSVILRSWLSEVDIAGLDRRVVLIHAVNPWGWIFARRWDAAGVDLNRNFVYSTDGSTSPRQPTPLNYHLWQAWQKSDAGACSRILAMTAEALGAEIGASVPGAIGIIPVGQYAFPDELFFGGETLSDSTRIVQSHLARWIGDATTIVQLDFHSGLGESGQATLLIDIPRGTAATRVEEIFANEKVRCGDDGTGTYYPTEGSWESWCRRRFSDREYHFVTVEFGTYDVARMLGTLVRENCAWQAYGKGDPRRGPFVEEIRESYSCESPEWRTKVLAGGLRLMELALRG